MVVRVIGYIGYVCPICGDLIEALSPEETKNAPTPEDWEPNLSANPVHNALDFAAAQNMAANEALILSHYELSHSMRELAVALGAARSALQDIWAMVDQRQSLPPSKIAKVIERGLGGK